MLKELLFVSADLLLIKDCLEFSGKWLIKSVLTCSETSFQTCLLICVEEPPERYLKDLDQDVIARITKVNCCEKQDKIIDCLSAETYTDQNILVVIDCVTPLVRQFGSGAVCRTLEQILKKRKEGQQLRLFTVIHFSVSDLEDYFTTVLTVLPTDHNLMCHIVHKPRNKNVTDRIEYFEVDQDYNLRIKAEVKEEKAVKLEADPTTNLTFNLNLSDVERSARSNVHLPYMFHTKREHNLSGGHIYYEEDNEDFDEEDPDDDLEV